MRSLKLIRYDKKENAAESISFFKRLLKVSGSGLLFSVLFIGILLGLDFSAKYFTELFYHSQINFLNSIADFLYSANKIAGVKFVEYFKDIIVIIAGLLGVILGLFFTTFLNIITTKYANINSLIVSQIQEEKVINRYFKFLSILVSSAIIFQFLLIIGYKPTAISIFIFTLTVIIAVLAFIWCGKYSLQFFNASRLVSDLIAENNDIVKRMYKNKKHFYKNKNGKRILSKIAFNIQRIFLIVEESATPQLSNTNFDTISDELLDFAIYYNSIKQIFPSNKDWHNKIQKYKKWDEASDTDYITTGKFGFLLPQNVDDYLHIERIFIDTQFYIFKNLIKSHEKIQIPYNQQKYLQVLAYQCEVELFKLFFDKLEQYVKDNLTKTDDKVNENNLSFISLYANLLVQYLVGFNYNFDRIVNEKGLRDLAKAVHNQSCFDKLMAMPYQIRVWIDKHQEKLFNEKFYNGKIITPLFYTEHELANQFQLLFKSSFVQISDDLHKRIINFSEYLKTEKRSLEALEFLSEAMDVYRKIEYFSEIIEQKIVNILDKLRGKQEEGFSFVERIALLEKNSVAQQNSTDEMWRLGLSSYDLNNSNLPDIFGNFYQLISQDILDKAFDENDNKLTEYLPKFYLYNMLYLEHLRQKYSKIKPEDMALRLMPIVQDLFEISAITIILFKAHNNQKLKDCFFNFWDDYYKKDTERFKNFWRLMYAIYSLCDRGTLLGNYQKKYEREQRLAEFLKQGNLVRLETITEDSFYLRQCYVTDVDDVYFKEIVRTMDINGLENVDLSEVFIECYLRQQESLKDLNIKETRYGEDVRTNMERDSE